MNDAIVTAIISLSEKAKDAKLPQEAMQFAQAALNLAHTAQVVRQTEVTK